MAKRHVLIVDDAKDILFLLMHSVKRLGPNYEVSTATDAASAMAQLQRQKFDLVITDYMMPGMTGIDLAQAVRKISPETQVVLMTAYDTRSMRDTVDTLKLGGFLGKPFTVAEIIDVVQRAIARTAHLPTENLTPPPATDVERAIQEHLQTLRSKTGAYYVILVSTSGHPIQVVGEPGQAKAARLAAFVAANFLAVTELASLLGDSESIFKSSYHEGSKYNIYAYDVNGKVLLAVVFGAQGKPGTIWFYTKQTGLELAELLKHIYKSNVPGDKSAVAAEFDNVFGQNKSNHPQDEE
jgi:CheY-like chemotaxis protein/predicted regulator of Ras-like GTPase activity (Roadblock/LC7/MglB family)